LFDIESDSSFIIDFQQVRSLSFLAFLPVAGPTWGRWNKGGGPTSAAASVCYFSTCFLVIVILFPRPSHLVFIRKLGLYLFSAFALTLLLIGLVSIGVPSLKRRICITPDEETGDCLDPSHSYSMLIALPIFLSLCILFLCYCGKPGLLCFLCF
jgi:hypothetical protein